MTILLVLTSCTTDYLTWPRSGVNATINDNLVWVSGRGMGDLIHALGY